MNRPHFFIRLVILMIVALFFTACKEKTPEIHLTLNKSELTLPPGDVATVILTVQPKDVNVQELYWYITNQNVAKLTQIDDFTAQITAIGNGTATLFVLTQDRKVEATCVVTVDENTPSINIINITLNRKELVLEPGDTTTLIATIQPENAINKTVMWQSSNTAVATVTNNGLVTAINNGKTTITATNQDGDKSATCIVTVKKNVNSVTLNKNELALLLGDTETLIATVQPENATNTTVTWASSNSAVATVTDNGLVTAVADGKATITVTTQDGGKTANCSVSVDYRNKWIGDWDFMVFKRKVNVDSIPQNVYCDTVYYSGKITLSDNPNPMHSIYLQYLVNESLYLRVSEDGEFFGGHPYLYGGGFEGNNKLFLSYKASGGLGGWIDRYIRGTKKERRSK